jgi:peptide/nickel transport system substrate-binding protein
MATKKIWWTALSLLVISCLFLVACAPKEAPPTEPPVEEPPVEEPTVPPPVVEPAEPKIVTIAWTQEPNTLNRSYSSMWYMAALTEVFSCRPWMFDENNEPFPSLLTEMPTVSADGLVITMNLRDDITWSDGTPITADDFVFTHTMITDVSNTVSSVYPYDLFTVDAPDAQTVVMNSEEPYIPWIGTIWIGDLMPKHVLQPVFDSEGTIDEADWNMAPTVGCGPFVFTEWESGSFIRFDKNENYWGDVPKLDAVVYQFVPDDAAQTAAALAGDVDIAFWPPYEDIPAFRDAGLNIVTQASGYNEGWYFNMREMASPGIKDLVVRQAIAMSLDRASNTAIRLSVVKPVKTFWAALPAYEDPTMEPWPYDPEAAKQLLEDAGYVDSDGDGIREDLDGNPLTFTQGNTTKEERLNYQAVAQQQLREVGIDLQILSYDADIMFADYAGDGPSAVGDLDIMQWSDAPWFPDPDTAYWLCSEVPSDENPWGGNYFICDETLDALLQKQAATVDEAERTAIFHEISRYMHENVYWLGIWEDPDVWILSPRLTGYLFSGVTCFFNIMDWDLVE